MDKAPEAFRTISEVATELDIPKHVLRFWETKFPQLKPMKRGGGRRYYRPEDIDLLRGIRTLLYDEGYTIKGLQKVFRQSGVTYVKNCWRSDLVDEQTLPQKPTTPIPDIAGETAEHARKGTQRRKERAKAAPKAQAKKKTDSLTPETRELLLAALTELEQCRALLVAASAKSAQQS